jgi:hypothetical protein
MEVIATIPATITHHFNARASPLGANLTFSAITARREGQSGFPGCGRIRYGTTKGGVAGDG